MSDLLPWPERVGVIAVNPFAASGKDVMRLAAEWQEMKPVFEAAIAETAAEDAHALALVVGNSVARLGSLKRTRAYTTLLDARRERNDAEEARRKACRAANKSTDA
jgi:hypothetical protein